MPETATPAPPIRTAVSAPRLESIDALRGWVMVLMALDHTRDFFSNDLAFDPLDLERTYPALFLARWITHFCAPVFIFLAGTSAFLSLGRGRDKRELSWFLWTRGLWCIVLELTVIRSFGWSFEFGFQHTFGLVFWAIGWSMIALSVLIFLPVWAVGVFGMSMMALHNLLDPLQPGDFGAAGWLWKILHEGGRIDLGGGYDFGAGYPLIPWVGVMAAGFAFGTVVTRPDAGRRRLFGLGIGMTVLFILLRGVNVYGDAQRWSPRQDFVFTAFSFLNCVKYPPSLCYLLMTLGPALIVLGWLDRGVPRWMRPVMVFGQVPLFFYLLHLPLIHGLAVGVALIRHGQADWLLGDLAGPDPGPRPDTAGFGLPGVYFACLIVVLILYPACVWFAGVKRRRPSRWLSYL